MVLAREIAAGRSKPVDDATIEKALKLARAEEWNERTRRLEESRRKLLRLDENAQKAWDSVYVDLLAVELGEHPDDYDDAWERLRSTGFAKEASDLCKLRDSIAVLEEFARSDKPALVLTLEEGGELVLVALTPDVADVYLKQSRGGAPSSPI